LKSKAASIIVRPIEKDSAMTGSDLQYFILAYNYPSS